MFLGFLHSSPLREHTKYLGQSIRIPLHPLTTLAREEGIFAALRRETPNQKAWEARKNAWISEDMWRLIDEGVSTRQKPEKGQTRIWRLIRAIAASLKGDSRRRVETARAEVEQLLGADPSMPQEMWQRLKRMVQGCGQL